MLRRLLQLAFAVAILATVAEATVHRVYNLYLQKDNIIQQHVNDTSPITEECHWFEKNGTSLDGSSYVRMNATTDNGKGFCVLKVLNFELKDNGRNIVLKYRGHMYALEIMEGPDPNRYFFIVFFILLHLTMLAFVVFLGLTYRTCRRRSGQVKLLLVPS
jgi:hypothetical protein